MSSPVATSAVDATSVDGLGMSSYDILLETLCYLRDGSWGGFEQALEAVDAIEPIDAEVAFDAARVFSALGHMDVQLDRRTLRPITWTTSPPTLLRLRDSEWLLCGRRPTRLVGAIRAVAEQAGGSMTIDFEDRQPARLLVSVPSESVGSLVDAAADAGEELFVNRFGVTQLALALPSLSTVVQALPSTIPSIGGAIERLDPDRNGRLTWNRVRDFELAGAYRFDPAPLTYVFVTSNGSRPIRVNARLARLLALLERGLGAFAWNPDGRMATVPYYAEPPLLYERALSLSGGYAPRSTPYQRVTTYRGVTHEVAAAVNARLLNWRGEMT
jgi:hypothetical protein